MALNVLSKIVIPNVGILKAAVAKAVDRIVVENRWNRAVDTQAYCILNDTGLDEFLDKACDDARRQAAQVLTQILANADIEGAKKFLDELVDDLHVELTRMQTAESQSAAVTTH